MTLACIAIFFIAKSERPSLISIADIAKTQKLGELEAQSPIWGHAMGLKMVPLDSQGRFSY